jgi:hypothetical protein
MGMCRTDRINKKKSSLLLTSMIKNCLCLIKYILRCFYIEDCNRLMFSTKINKGWKLEVDIDDVKFGTGSDN